MCLTCQEGHGHGHSHFSVDHRGDCDVEASETEKLQNGEAGGTSGTRVDEELQEEQKMFKSVQTPQVSSLFRQKRML